jgi:hypothetical protein
MKTARLARRLGLDGNPLRRRIDKIAACLAALLMALLMALFLIGAPMLSMAAARWVGHAAAAGQRAARSWRQVPAVLPRGAPLPAVGGVFGTSWVMARWTAPDGHERAGRIAVSTSLAAGRTVQLWVDTAGSPTGPLPRYDAPVASEALVAVLATAVLGAVLWWLAGSTGGCWTGAGSRPGKRRGPLSARSGPGASGGEASPDGPARGHRGVASAGWRLGGAS